jgi:hypothetical protein
MPHSTIDLDRMLGLDFLKERLDENGRRTDKESA